MALTEVAERLEEAGVAPAEAALRSLSRCRPSTAPVYRDGDRYYLDPHDESLDRWLLRLGLRPPKVRVEAVKREPPKPLPSPDTPLTIEELDEAWKDKDLISWSGRRLALAVLDAHGGELPAQEVADFVSVRTKWHGLRPDNPAIGRRGSPIQVLPDGAWCIGSQKDALLATRQAVRERLAVVRRSASLRRTPEEIEAIEKRREAARAERAKELASLRRAILYAYPRKKPEAVTLLDVGGHSLETFSGEGLTSLRERLEAFDVLAALGVRELLRALEFEHGSRRLVELDTPQKTKRINKSGRTLEITIEMLIRDSCGISRPFGDEKKIATYLREGQGTRLRRRLESSAKSLFAAYQYGRLHGSLRLRWGFLDEAIQVPWVEREETCIYDLKKEALKTGAKLEVVVGSAPGWEDEWARRRIATVKKGAYFSQLVDEGGLPIDERDIQRVRLAPGDAH